MTNKRVLLLISDTGGGHRSAANAIIAALDELPGEGRELKLEIERRGLGKLSHKAVARVRTRLGIAS